MAFNRDILKSKKALLLDMNGTFMFGEDRFEHNEDFSVHYKKLGGVKYAAEINRMIRAAYSYLEERYSNESYCERFPSVKEAVQRTSATPVDRDEMRKIVQTFAFHELGNIPQEYKSVLLELSDCFILATVIDIWAPKALWLDAFRRAGVIHLFSAMYFSSDQGIVKPSPKPFEWVLSEINVRSEEALMIGDSVRRDLGGASRAGIDCVLVGGASHPKAMACVNNLLELSLKN